jgi:hypothetical protein
MGREIMKGLLRGLQEAAAAQQDKRGADNGRKYGIADFNAPFSAGNGTEIQTEQSTSPVWGGTAIGGGPNRAFVFLPHL